ncbi:hypothetical protein K502DRAFT_351955 [Neoconidiobolus thromboides FSU 785]|nr:hypothetical protein K502DRAFT_351955 [Neoconidiobolus thromboides FSU 785]
MYIPKEVAYSQPFEIFMFIYSIFSIILNLLVLYIVNIENTRGKAVDAYLITWIAVFDILVALSLDVTQIAKWSLSTTPIEFQESAYCSLSSILYNGTAISAMALTAQLSVVRYLAIVKSYTISNVKTNFISLVIVLVTVVIFIITKIKGVSRLLPSGLLCISTTETHVSMEHTIYVTIMFIIIYPIVFSIPLFYGLISLHYFETNQRLRASSGSFSKSVAFYKSKHIAFLFVFTLLYMCSLLPEFIVLVIEAIDDYERSYVVDCICLFLLFSETILNPLFVITLHPDSRKRIISLFRGEGGDYEHYQTTASFQYSSSKDLVTGTELSSS